MKSAIDRFEEKCIPGKNGCIEWSGAHVKGYSYFRSGTTTKTNMSYGHRWIYEFFKDGIPAGMQVDHLCRNRGCVNIDHMEIVTPRVNTLRGTAPSAINAKKTHCPRNHAYAMENTRVRDGSRVCRACDALLHREKRNRIREEGK